jgi:hypothetical protein
MLLIGDPVDNTIEKGNNGDNGPSGNEILNAFILQPVFDITV